MGSTSGDDRGDASVRGAVAQADDAGTDALAIELDPSDVWVLGQLIEAGAASFPPEIEAELLTGYRILAGSGYEPPPTRGAPNIELSANIEDRERDAASQATPGQEAKLPLVREVVLAEVVSQPAPAVLNEALTEHAGTAASSLERIADRFEHREASQANQPDAPTQADPEPADDGISPAAVDLGLVGIDVTAATLLAFTAAVLGDPVFAMLALGLLGIAGFLAIPYLDPAGGSAR